jgi:mono/diheme cytochrome c family protein
MWYMRAFHFVFAIELVAMLALSSCRFQSEDSFSQDRLRYTPSGDTSSASLAAVRTIFRAQCTSCHAAFASYSDEQWVATGYIVAGSPSTSTLYMRLRGSKAGGPENMPPTGGLTSNELTAVSRWIESVKNASDQLTGADARRVAALDVLSRNCNSCHGVNRVAVASADTSGATVTAFSKFSTDSQFVLAGLVVPGNADDSWLTESLKGWGSLATMPKGLPAISATDADILRDWIDEIGRP